MNSRSNMIQIRPGGQGHIIVVLPFTPERVAKIKTIEGRRWNPDRKYWTVPAARGMAARLLALFDGEAVEIAPSLRAPASDTPNPRREQGTLIDKVRRAIRARHLSPRTEAAYIAWIQRFLKRIDRRPEDLGEGDIPRFISDLALRAGVSASTQNQALNALLFLYQQVLRKKIGYVDGIVRAKRPKRLPVVLSREEVRKIISRIRGPARIQAMLLYGAGLRLLECCTLRVKDIDFHQNLVWISSDRGAWRGLGRMQHVSQIV